MGPVRSVAGFATAAIVLGLFCSRAAAAPLPPPEAFAVLPDEAPQISPDGKYFAVRRGINGRPGIAIYQVDAPAQLPLLFTSADWLVDGMRWAKSDVLLVYNKKNVTLGSADNVNFLRQIEEATAILVNERKQVQLSAYMQIEDIDLDDPDIVYATIGGSLYSMNVRAPGRPQLVMSGLHGIGYDGTAKWFLDGHGKVVARVDSAVEPNSLPQKWHFTLKLRDKGDWRDIANFDGSVDRDDGIAGLSEDGFGFLRIAADGQSTLSIRRVDAGGGAETELYKNSEHDVEGLLVDEWTGRAVGYTLDEDMPVFRYFDPKREALQKGLEKAFPGLSVHAISEDIAQDKVIAAVEGPQIPPSYYLVNRVTHQAISIAASNPDLDVSALGEVRPYPYAARDGLPIHAYLTLPPGKPAKNLPLVVMPHGGPDARDDMTFDWWSQFLATRGYAVLRPNFRGSTGYGFAFHEAGFHQWGLKMQDDISDGVKKAIADGIADPKRVCIVGASYGGYAALAGATLSPDLYACIISYAGIGNLSDLLGYDARFGESITHGSFNATRIGDSFSDAAQLRATSPQFLADRVRAPVLLLHSELDVTVPIYQSENMETALKKAGKSVQFVRLPGDDHYLSLEQTRLALLKETERFLAAHIGD
jgi:dipeptidyl aminopeptidase/acylaminoacyl peptidase